MSFRITAVVAGTLLVMLGGHATVFAQGVDSDVVVGGSAPDAGARPVAGESDLLRPSPIMWSLYVTTAVVQGLDAHSTFRAIDAGAVERNPLIGSIADHRPAFVVLKAGIAAATIYAGQNLSKRHKVLAVVALVGVNAAYGALVARNYRIVGRGR